MKFNGVIEAPAGWTGPQIKAYGGLLDKEWGTGAFLVIPPGATFHWPHGGRSGWKVEPGYGVPLGDTDDRVAYSGDGLTGGVTVETADAVAAVYAYAAATGGRIVHSRPEDLKADPKPWAQPFKADRVWPMGDGVCRVTTIGEVTDHGDSAHAAEFPRPQMGAAPDHPGANRIDITAKSGVSFVVIEIEGDRSLAPWAADRDTVAIVIDGQDAFVIDRHGADRVRALVEEREQLRADVGEYKAIIEKMTGVDMGPAGIALADRDVAGELAQLRRERQEMTAGVFANPPERKAIEDAIAAVVGPSAAAIRYVRHLADEADQVAWRVVGPNIVTETGSPNAVCRCVGLYVRAFRASETIDPLGGWRLIV